jgi:predicted nucleotidyltransferase
MELIRVAEILIEKIKKDYRDDVALVIIMGSYIYNDTHSRSDLDLYFIPKTERGNKLGFTFIIDDIGFDFWPISWERLERIANFEEKTTSIITEGKILYCSSQTDMERFDKIKSKASDVTDRMRFIQKAKEKLDGAYKDYYKLSGARTFYDAGIYGIGIMYTVTYALSLLNGITVKRGRGKLKQEILNMPLIPDNFPALYDAAFAVKDIDTLCDIYRKLIYNTEALIYTEEQKYKKPNSFADTLNGFYEESINFYNKIYHACETGDKVTALCASVELTCEIQDVLKVTDVSPKILPDIISAYDPDNLNHLALSVKNHQTKFVELLTENGVVIRKFKGFNELKSYLDLL